MAFELYNAYSVGIQANGSKIGRTLIAIERKIDGNWIEMNNIADYNNPVIESLNAAEYNDDEIIFASWFSRDYARGSSSINQ